MDYLLLAVGSSLVGSAISKDLFGGIFLGLGLYLILVVFYNKDLI